jgi:hypothetical protein
MARGRLKLACERLAVNGKQANLARERKKWPTVAREAIFVHLHPPLSWSKGVLREKLGHLGHQWPAAKSI